MTKKSSDHTLPTETSHLLEPEKNLGHLIRLLHSSMAKMVNEGMKPLGLTRSQWLPIVLIGYGRARTPAQIAKIVEVDTGAITRTLDRLEAKQFITRHRSKTDRRVIELSLTTKGKDIMDFVGPIFDHAIHAHSSALSTEEYIHLCQLLLRMLVHAHPNMVENMKAESSYPHNRDDKVK